MTTRKFLLAPYIEINISGIEEEFESNFQIPWTSFACLYTIITSSTPSAIISWYDALNFGRYSKEY